MTSHFLEGLLHLGNVKVVKKSRRGDDAKIEDDDTHVQIASALFGVDDKMLQKWLTSRKIQTGREIFIKPMTLDEAQFSMHALAKHIYAHIFDWVVERLNESLEGTTAKLKDRRFIGVLDIYGFETFKVNSFEQFCINYANEKLQQLFNLHIFKLEQEEYVREEIQWSFIDFYDNQPCIDLIEEKLGILSLLDEECKVPKGNDKSWVIKMYQAFGEHHHFTKPRLSETAFIVSHYAGDVTYEVDGFVTKNKDSLSAEHMQMLQESQVPIVAEMFTAAAARKAAAEASAAAKGGGGSIKKKKSNRATVGTQFQSSLTSLMSALNATEPHYIRCLKPNDNKAKFEYDRPRCMEQLKACGVLETVRISAAGFPSRWSYTEFLERYAMLAPNPLGLDRSDEVAACKTIVVPLIADEDKLQFGLTKIFFRAGQVAYLEKLRGDKRAAAAVMIQKNFKSMQLRKEYLRMRAAATKIQANVRGWMDRQLVAFLREDNAAIRIQTAFRRWKAVMEYTRAKAAILTIQRFARGMAGRKKFRIALENDRACRIQTVWRGMVARHAYARTRAAVVMLQSHYRRVLAYRIFKELRAEAKSVSGIKSKNVALEKQVLELHAKLKAALEEAESSKAAASELESKGAGGIAEADHEALQAELSAAKAEIAELKEGVAAQVVQFEEEAAAQAQLNFEQIQELKNSLKAAAAAAQEDATAQEAVYSDEIDRLKEELRAAAAAAASAVVAAVLEVPGAPEAAVATQQPASLTERALEDDRLASASASASASAESGGGGRLKAAEEEIKSLQEKLDSASAEVARLVEGGTIKADGPATSPLATSSSSGGNENPGVKLNAKLAEANAKIATISSSDEKIEMLLVEIETSHAEKKELVAELDASEKKRAKLAAEVKALCTAGTSVPEAPATPAAADGEKRLPQPPGKRRKPAAPGGKQMPAPPGGKQMPAPPGGKKMPAPPGGKKMPAPPGGKKQMPAPPGGKKQPTAPGSGANTSSPSTSPAMNATATADITLQADVARLQMANTHLLGEIAELEEKAKAAASEDASKQAASATKSIDIFREAAEHAAEIEKMATELQAALDAKITADITVQESAERIEALEKEATMWKKQCKEAGADDVMAAEVEVLQQQLKEAKSAETRLKRNLATVESAAKTQQTVGNLLKSTMDRTNKEVTELRAKIQAKNKLLAQHGGSGGGSSSYGSSSSSATSSSTTSSSPSADVKRLQEEIQTLNAEVLNTREKLEDATAKVEAFENAAGASGAGAGSRTAAAGGDASALEAVDDDIVGMIQLAEADVPRLINECIRQLEPSRLQSSIPGISTHIIFMCILYADQQKNGAMLQGLLFNAMGAIKEVVAHSAADIATLAFWTSNTYQLLSNMRQFSGEAQFKSGGSTGRRKQRTFANFDLKQYRKVLADLFTQIFRTVVKNVEHQLEPLIVPAVLDHEPIPGLGGSGSPTSRGPGIPAVSVATLIELIDSVYKHLLRENVHGGVIRLVFRQVFYTVNCKLVNTLLVRKDYCHVFKGMQIRQNLTMVEEWARDNKLDITSSLVECIQISQLLQMEKSDVSHASFILSNCNRLNTMQLQKVLQMYTPTQQGEKLVPAKLIKAVVAKAKTGADYVMDSSKMLPVQFPYEPCAPDFRRIAFPTELNLEDYLTLI